MKLNINKEKLENICQQYDVQKLHFFGSVVHGDFSNSSDIDILVEFLPGKKPSLLGLGRMQQDLEGIFKREVDLKTPGFFKKENLNSILEESRLQYEAA